MTAALLALGASLVLGTSDFLGGWTTKKVSVVLVLFYSQLVACLLALGRLGLAGLELHAGAIRWGLAAGVAAVIATAALFRGLAIGTMGVVAPITALGVLIPVGWGLIHGNDLTAWLGLGAVLAIVGTVLAAGPEVKLPGGARHDAHVKSLWLAGLAATGFGLNTVFVAAGSKVSVDTTVAAVMVSMLVLLLLAAAAWRLTRPVSLALAGHLVLPVLAIGILGFVGMFLLAAATAQGQLAIVAVLASLYPTVTIIWGRVFLTERLSPIQVIGVICTLAGVAALAGL